jgi:hypothetical protein
MSQPLSDPLRAGLRFLPRPLPAAPSARLAEGLPSREDDGLTTLHRRNPRGLGPALTPVALHLRRMSLQHPDLATYLLVRAYQHLRLVFVYDARGGSPGLAVPRAPGPRPPWCWQSRSRLAPRSPPFSGEDPLSRGLRTPPSPATHASVGDCWQNSRCRHLLREEQHTSCDTLVSHAAGQEPTLASDRLSRPHGLPLAPLVSENARIAPSSRR